jgi:hypothetical protein
MKKMLLCFGLGLALLACNNAPKPADSAAAKTAAPSDGYTVAKGMFYCEGMVAADGLGCLIKIDGTVYKMQGANNELYEESAAFDKAGQPVPMEVEYKPTGQYHKMMDGSNGPAIILIRSIKEVTK